MWFVAALVIGAAIATLVFWLRSRDIKVAWYEWLIGAIGLLMLVFAIQNFVGAGLEAEPDAANTFLGMVGVPALILLAVSVSLVWRRQSTSS